jgi:hypothetical protein
MLLEDFSLSSLQSVLADAFFESEIQGDGELLYVHEGLDFPLWIAIVDEQSLLKIYTYIDLKEGTNEIQGLRLANRISASYAPNSVYFDDDDNRLYSFYFEVLEGPMAAKKLVSTLRRCAGSFVAAIRSEDTEDLID